MNLVFCKLKRAQKDECKFLHGNWHAWIIWNMSKRELLIPPASESEFECDEESCKPVLLKEGRALGSDIEKSALQSEVGFGDGAFFDQTPERLDYDYFRILKNSANEGFDNIVHWCCGKIRKCTCDALEIWQMKKMKL